MGIDDVFAVIAEGTRREILGSLRAGDKSVGELVAELNVSQPTVSKHLKVLREAGLVSPRAQGQKRFYSLDAAPLAAVQEWLTEFAPADAADAVSPAGAAPEDHAGAQQPGDRAGLPAGEPAPAESALLQPDEESAAEPLAAAALAVPADAPPTAAEVTRQQQIGRTVGRAAERASDLFAQLRRRREKER